MQVVVCHGVCDGGLRLERGAVDSCAREGLGGGLSETLAWHVQMYGGARPSAGSLLTTGDVDAGIAVVGLDCERGKGDV